MTAPPAPPPWWVRLRLHEPCAAALQLGLLLAVLLVGWAVAGNVVANMARLNLHAGFGFLQRSAGFDIAQTLIAYPPEASYLRAFWVALLNTVLIAAIAIVGATALALPVALCRLSANPLLRGLSALYVEVVRNVPLLLQLFFWYFAVLGPLPQPRQSLSLGGLVFLNKRGLFLPAPEGGGQWGPLAWSLLVAVGVAFVALRLARRRRIATARPQGWLRAAALAPFALALSLALAGPPPWDVPRLAGFNIAGGVGLIPECVAMAVGLTVYGSAFVAELFRAGILTVGRGQVEAGRALGLTRARILIAIVLPQALRAVVPPLTGQYITLLKNSSLAAAIGYPDLMLIFAGTALNQTGQPLEIMGITMLSYLALSLGTSALGNAVNRRLRIVER